MRIKDWMEDGLRLQIYIGRAGQFQRCRQQLLGGGVDG
jgi:hypothetical protein